MDSDGTTRGFLSGISEGNDDAAEKRLEKNYEKKGLEPVKCEEQNDELEEEIYKSNEIWILLTNASNGDDHALAELLHKMQPLVKKYSRSLGYEEAEAELRLALLILLRKYLLGRLVKFTPGGVLVYISKAMRHEAIRLEKRHAGLGFGKSSNGNSSMKTLPFYELDYIQTNIYSYTPNQELNFEERIDTRLLLLSLPQRQRYIIEQIYIEDKSVRSVADYLHITSQAVSKARKIALTMLGRVDDVTFC